MYQKILRQSARKISFLWAIHEQSLVSLDGFLFVVLSQWPCFKVVWGKEVSCGNFLYLNLPPHPMSHQNTVQITSNTTNIYKSSTILLTSTEEPGKSIEVKVLQNCSVTSVADKTCCAHCRHSAMEVWPFPNSSQMNHSCICSHSHPVLSECSQGMPRSGHIPCYSLHLKYLTVFPPNPPILEVLILLWSISSAGLFTPLLYSLYLTIYLIVYTYVATYYCVFQLFLQLSLVVPESHVLMLCPSLWSVLRMDWFCGGEIVAI